MNEKDIMNAIGNVGDDIVEKTGRGKATVLGTPLRTRGLRIAAVAACVALLATGMLAAMPFMFKDNNVADVTEPQGIGTNSGEIVENTQETADTVDEISEQTKYPFQFLSPPGWIGNAIVPYAILEIIGDTGETYRDCRKIQCSVKYERNTGYLAQSYNPGFKDIDVIYIPQNIADDFLNNTMVFIKVSLLCRNQKDENCFTIGQRSKGEYIYYSIVDDKLIIDNPDDDLLKETLSLLDNLDDELNIYGKLIADAFPRKKIESGMMVDELISLFNALDEARNVWMEWRKQAEGYI